MSFLELLAWSVWDTLRPRKLLTMLLVALPGPGFALLFRLRANPADYNPQIVYGLVAPTAVYSFTLVLLSIIFASGIVSSEMVGKTIVYLLTRPIPRYKILLAKWLGATIVVSLATGLACALTALIAYGPSRLGESNLFRDLYVIGVGVATYCALFTCVSVLSTKPWIFAISFGFLWESWVPLVPGDMQKLSIMAHLRSIAAQSLPSTSAPQDVFEALRTINQQVIPQSTAWNSVILITLVSLVVAAVVFSTAEFVPRDETT